jgi:hypothetical protein
LDRVFTLAAISLSINRQTLARGLVWLAAGCVIASAIGFRPQSQHLIGPALLLLAGGGALIAALWLRPDWGVPALPAAVTGAVDRRVRWLPLSAGFALLVLLGLRGGQFVLPVMVHQILNIHAQVVLLLAGGALLIMGVGGARRSDLHALRTWIAANRREILLVLAIMTVALAIRAYQIQDTVRAFIDEGPFINAVAVMRENPAVPLAAPIHPTNSFTRLFTYMQMILSDVFGSSLGMFRFASAICGALTAGALYGLARKLFDRRTAFIAAILLAVLPPHIHLSRSGINNIADPLFGVLALVFFARGVQTRSRLDYALAGFMLGLLPYFYEGGELLFPPLVLLWALMLALSKGPRPSLRGVGWMLLVALGLALPVYYTNLSYDLPVFTRLNAANAGPEYLLAMLIAPNGFTSLRAFFSQRLLPPLLHYVHSPDSGLYYGGETALLLSWLVPLFLLGLFHALRHTSSALLTVWVLVTALGNSLIQPPDWTARFVVVMPAVTLLCAVGLRYTLPLLGWRVLKRGSITKGFLVAAAVAQLAYYFGPHLTYYNGQMIDQRRYYDVVIRTLELPPDTVVYFNFKNNLEVPFAYSFLKYLDAPYEFHATWVQDLDLASLARDRRYAFFVQVGDNATLDVISKVWYLDGPHFSPDGPPDQFALYIVTPWLWREDAEPASVR